MQPNSLEKTEARYIGWIPTVGQRLSYSLIGQTNHPSEAITSNIATKRARYIVCLQKRHLLDGSFPVFNRLIARFFWNTSGDFQFLLVAKCVDEKYLASSPLEGSVYIFHEESRILLDKNSVINNNEPKTWSKLKKSITEAQKHLNAFESSRDKIDLSDYFSNNVEPLLGTLSHHYIYKADFILKRNGIIKIISANHNKSKAEVTHLRDKTSTQKDHLVCSQIFFFLKDIIHRHQHHHPKTDTILDIYDENNPFWACEILRALYKKVLSYKRDQAEGIYSSALGVLAYVKAFKKVCKEDIDIKQDNLVTSRDDDTLIESIKAAQDDLRFVSNQKNRINDTIRTWIFSVIGLMLTFTSLAKLQKQEISIESDNNYIESLANIAINSPIYLGLATASTIMFFVFSSNWEYYLRRFFWIKNIGRSIQGFKQQKISAAIVIATAVIVGMLAYYIALIPTNEIIQSIETFVPKKL